MINEVTLSGRVVDIRDDDGKYYATIETVRRYGASGESTNLFNVILPAGGALKSAFDLAESKKKPLYVALTGVLANRKFADDDKYANHTLIVALSVGAFGTSSEQQWARATFVGTIGFAKFQYTQKGTPFVRILVRNTRTVKVRGEEKDISSSVFVTLYNVDEDTVGATLQKGTQILVNGRLDSYEANSTPGAYVTTLVADDVYTLGALDVAAQREQTTAAQTVVQDVEAEDDDDDILDF